MKIGLVLSGGGVRGVAHLGVIKALEENGIRPHVISGTSAGAIVGALYSAGHAVDEILSIITDLRAFRMVRPALSWRGILKMDVIEKFLEEYLPHDSFESLKIPLFITATNIKTGESEYFSSGKLRAAICASSCIPVIFDPVTYNDQLYIDGGILNNLPVEPIRSKSDIIIGSHCNPVNHDFEIKNARGVMERALMLAITQNAYNRKDLCDFFIEIKGLESFKVMDLSKAREIYNIGYEYAHTQIIEDNLIEMLSHDV